MTERDLTADLASAISAGTVRPAIFYEGVFVTGGVDTYLRMWTGIGTLAWNGADWLGGGKLLGISVIEESIETRAINFSVSFSGISAENISIAQQAVRQGKAGRLWLAAFDAAGALVADPYPLRRGRLDVSVISRDSNTISITASYEDRLVALETPRERRYTDQDQQIDHPGDKGFEFVPSLQDTQLTWGR